MFVAQMRSGAIHRKSSRKFLERVYRLSGEAILGTFNTTSSASTRALASIRSPDIDIMHRVLMIKGRLELSSGDPMDLTIPLNPPTHPSPTDRLRNEWKLLTNASTAEGSQCTNVESKVASREDLKSVNSCIIEHTNSREGFYGPKRVQRMLYALSVSVHVKDGGGLR